jgi:hypothetical protein
MIALADMSVLRRWWSRIEGARSPCIAENPKVVKAVRNCCKILPKWTSRQQTERQRRHPYAR